jgi:adenine-specific DNA-methyltransferase
MEIAKLNEVFVQRISNGATMEDLDVVWNEMQASSFLSYKLSPALEEIRKIGFEGLSLPEVRTFLLTVLDHNMLYIPASEIRDSVYGIAKEAIEINEDFYRATK